MIYLIPLVIVLQKTYLIFCALIIKLLILNYLKYIPDSPLQDKSMETKSFSESILMLKHMFIILGYT